MRLLVIVFTALLAMGAVAQADPTRPNIVIIFTDDQGYADVGVFGAKGFKTPNLDRMTHEGMRLTDFYAGQAVCSASRGALLTGCYPTRTGILNALGPKSKIGISSNEKTIADVLKAREYATAIFGKWHLGDDPKFLPLRHGFDEYYGLPYSNDMWPKHPTGTYPDLPLIEGEKVLELNPDQRKLTTSYTERAVNFIERNKEKPFFLYVPHSMPHVPLHVSDKFAGKSERGRYGDVIMEIDWSVGQILDALKKNGLDENTMVMFASDNGPWLLYGDHAGSALPLREGKATTFDGGVRVPCILRWPGKIPPESVCSELTLTMDLLPTVAKLSGAEVPKDRIIDGKDIWPLLSGQAGAKSPHEAYFYYWGRHLQAVRSSKWKLHLSHSYLKPDPAGGGGKPGKYATKTIGVELFDLENDIGETTNVADQNPDVVKRLQELAQQCREDMGDSEMKIAGKNVREPGSLP